jgi:hypothetical protein
MVMRASIIRQQCFLYEVPDSTACKKPREKSIGLGIKCFFTFDYHFNFLSSLEGCF